MMSEKFLESCQNLLKLHEKFLGTIRLALNLSLFLRNQNPESIEPQRIWQLFNKN